jgi:hypothetical protein
MPQNNGGIRLKLSTNTQRFTAVLDPEDEAERLGARGLAKSIAAHTVQILLEGDMLAPNVAEEQLIAYNTTLAGEPHTNECILKFLFPDEGKLNMVTHWLNSRVNLHVWQIANRIPPPVGFYKQHPTILEACKTCGAVILDASSQSTLTTGSINPLTGEFLATWIQTALNASDPEARPRFFFHVEIPIRLWPGIMQSHFRQVYGV